MISFDEIKDVCDPVSSEEMVKVGLGWGGGDSNCFPIICHYVMKLYERFQMELMVSFDEIWPR